jgi:polar amino acid transport system substrate-binding protein
MKRRQQIQVLALLLSLVFLFAACGGTAPAASPAASAESGVKTLKSGVLSIGVDDNYPPMEFRDEKNELVGFDVDLAKAIGEKMGLTVEFQPIAWEGIFEALKTDRYDVIMSAVSLTPERMENFSFTKPYLANGQVIVSKPGDTTIKGPENLAGFKVGVQTNTTADTACVKYIDEKGIDFTLTRYDDIIQTFEAMNTGRIDYIVVDYAVAIDYQTKHPDKYWITGAQLTNEPIAVCLKKENTALRDEIQKAIDELRAEGKLAEFSKKWFKEDYTGNIDETLY